MTDAPPPSPDESGEIARCLRSIAWETTSLGIREQWPAALETLVGVVLAAPRPMALMWGRDLALIFNDAYCAMTGLIPGDTLGRPAREVWSELWPSIAPEIETVVEGRGSISRPEVCLPITRDGMRQEPWWCYTYSPVPDPTAPNGVAGILVVANEVTDTVVARHRQEDAEKRLRRFLENVPHLVWRGRADGSAEWVGPQWTAFSGVDAEAIRSGGCIEALHPDDRAATLAAWERAQDTGFFLHEFRLREAATGTYRWFQSRGKRVGGSGEDVEWVGAATDIDDLHKLQEHQKVLLAELQHRVRNTLAIIRSIARRTGETAESVADFASHFEGRLNAFARTQSRLARDPRSGIDLEYLIAEELTACAAREGARVRIDGPKVTLRPKAAETLTLAVHELATNAVKYGALSTPSGTVSVTWVIDAGSEAPRLVLSWREDGIVEDPERPVRDGFGTELLLRTLPYELEAEVDLDIGAKAVRCDIAMPLGRRILP